jgi:hypothetical protein
MKTNRSKGRWSGSDAEKGENVAGLIFDSRLWMQYTRQLVRYVIATTYFEPVSISYKLVPF